MTTHLFRRMLTGAVAAGLAMAVAGTAQAQRPATPSMSCSAAAALVAQRGAIVLTTGPNTYDRYVRDLSFCAGSEELKPEWVRTRDKAQCFIGYTCFVPSRDNFSR